MVASITVKAGRNNLLALGFLGTGTGFGYMAVGTGLVDPADSSTTLNSECVDGGTCGDYERATVSSTADEANGRVTSEATFDITNVTASTDLTELGIVNAETDGDFWCICTFPAINKDNTKSITLTVITTLV